MSNIEILKIFFKSLYPTLEVTIGKVKPKIDCIKLTYTGGKGYDAYRVFGGYSDYEIKFQILLYIKDIAQAYRLAEQIERDLMNAEVKNKEYELSLFKKLNGLNDLDFDSDDRKVISLNYTVDIINKSII